MADRLPTGDVAVYIFLGSFASALALECVEAFVARRPWFVWVSCLVLSLALFLTGINWPKIRSNFGGTRAAFVDRVAADPRYRYGIGFLLLVMGGIYGIVYLHSLLAVLDMYPMPGIISNQQIGELKE